MQACNGSSLKWAKVKAQKLSNNQFLVQSNYWLNPQFAILAFAYVHGVQDSKEKKSAKFASKGGNDYGEFKLACFIRCSWKWKSIIDSLFYSFNCYKDSIFSLLILALYGFDSRTDQSWFFSLIFFCLIQFINLRSRNR